MDVGTESVVTLVTVGAVTVGPTWVETTVVVATIPGTAVPPWDPLPQPATAANGRSRQTTIFRTFTIHRNARRYRTVLLPGQQVGRGTLSRRARCLSSRRPGTN